MSLLPPNEDCLYADSLLTNIIESPARNAYHANGHVPLPSFSPRSERRKRKSVQHVLSGLRSLDLTIGLWRPLSSSTLLYDEPSAFAQNCPNAPAFSRCATIFRLVIGSGANDIRPEHHGQLHLLPLLRVRGATSHTVPQNGRRRRQSWCRGATGAPYKQHKTCNLLGVHGTLLCDGIACTRNLNANISETKQRGGGAAAAAHGSPGWFFGH